MGNLERRRFCLNITGKFRWENAKDGGDPIAKGEIPLIIFDGMTYQFPEMLRKIDKTTGEFEQMFEGVLFKYTKVKSNFLKSLFGEIEEGNFDWEIKIDLAVYERIEVYKHLVPIHLHQPQKVF